MFTKWARHLFIVITKMDNSDFVVHPLQFFFTISNSLFSVSSSVFKTSSHSQTNSESLWITLTPNAYVITFSYIYILFKKRYLTDIILMLKAPNITHDYSKLLNVLNSVTCNRKLHCLTVSFQSHWFFWRLFSLFLHL